MGRSTTQKDAVSFLTEQHEQVRDLFAAIPKASGEERRERFQTLVRMLAVHETAEEMVVYPALRNLGDEGVAVTEARLAEEDQAKKDLADLERIDPTSSAFDEPFRRFQTAVESHAEAEEREVFPFLERHKDDEQLQRMAAALQVAEGMAPTHPHRSAPESAIGNVLVGPFVSMVDRVRDALRDHT
jgi:hemerythrin superfamily protein